MAFTRSRTAALNFTSPAGKTTASAGAGGAAPRVQAPMPHQSDNSWVDVSKLGGLLGMMTQDKTTPDISLQYTEPTQDYIDQQVAQMTPEDKAAMEASPFSVAWGSSTPVLDYRSTARRAWDGLTGLFS